MMNPATLLFIRHAATDLAGTFCGSTNPPLNELGRQQVSHLLEQLNAEPITAIYSSHLLRAQQTAQPVAEAHGAPLSCRQALREIHFGTWEGLTWDAIERLDPTLAARWVAEFPHLPTPGGEPIQLFRARILDEITELRRLAEPGKTVAVVTHAGPLRVLLEELGHYAPQHAWERTRDYTCIIRATQTSSNTFTIVN